MQGLELGLLPDFARSTLDTAVHSLAFAKEKLASGSAETGILSNVQSINFHIHFNRSLEKTLPGTEGTKVINIHYDVESTLRVICT
jgi:hypothetical protein